jgi:hypothetical protein
MASHSARRAKSVVAWMRPRAKAAATRSGPMCLMYDAPLEHERQRQADVAEADDADGCRLRSDLMEELLLLVHDFVFVFLVSHQSTGMP